jgi:hypothetical protein
LYRNCIWRAIRERQEKREAGLPEREHPAVMLGRITFWWGAARMQAVSAMKCTPQKMM